MIEITLLGVDYEESYTNMLCCCHEATFFHSIPYRNVLTAFLSCEPYYIIAIERDEVIGAIPTFLKKNSKYGNVLNSLPFFGSHGGLLVHSDFADDKKEMIKKLLLDGFNILARENNCVLSTIIASPYDRDVAFYETHLDYRFRDYRVAPVVEFRDEVANAEYEVMYHIIEPSLRRTIRRPLNHGITTEISQDFEPLFQMNCQSMANKSVNLHPWNYYQIMSKLLGERDYELIYAKKGETVIAGLLVFYFKDKVEYSIPAQNREHAIEQGTSLLIFEGMKKAIRSGFRYWSFGGTAESQRSLHKFKSRWGTKDYPYYYYVNQHRAVDHILRMKPEDILEEYKWFYVLPFSELGGAGITCQ